MTTSKIALVTGGSRGLGKHMALSLAQKGIDVILTYHSQQAEAQATVAEIEALGRKALAVQLNTADLSSFDVFYQQVAQALPTTFGTSRFDFLVNNAGTSLTVPIADTTEAQFDDMLNIHFKGVYFLTQKALALLNDGGRIINISSATTRSSFAGVSVYASMKGAVEVFTRYLAVELGARGIAANVVAPGAIFGGGAMTDTPELRAYLPDDVGGVVAFLCTEEAKWLNGQRIEVTGGMTL
jgi:NAD(P)-dependent dehydrogenase (short-subunit alcohol dehydrogenase family)